MNRARTFNLWAWIGILYFIEGLPNVLTTTVSTVFYKQMGMDIALVTKLVSWLALPWMIKALWSPIVESLGTRRSWILVCNALFAGAFLLLAVSVYTPYWLYLSVFAFLFLAFASATFDIAADGFYMLALDSEKQAFFVGIRNTFYRLALIFAQGGLLFFVGKANAIFDSGILGWSLSFGICALIALISFPTLGAILPKPSSDINQHTHSMPELFMQMFKSFAAFFKKKDIVFIIIFIVFYRFAEGQLVKIVQPFLLDDRALGGLGFKVHEVGIIYGTFGVAALLLGGILGGVWISKTSLKSSLWIMALALNVPNLIYIYLTYAQPESSVLVSVCVFIEQFGYGFGFAGYMMYLIYVADGENKTSHYAMCTALMALGIFISGYYSGEIQKSLGYPRFFEWVCISTLVSFFATFCAYKTFRKPPKQIHNA